MHICDIDICIRRRIGNERGRIRSQEAVGCQMLGSKANASTWVAQTRRTLAEAMS